MPQGWVHCSLLLEDSNLTASTTEKHANDKTSSQTHKETINECKTGASRGTSLLPSALTGLTVQVKLSLT